MKYENIAVVSVSVLSSVTLYSLTLSAIYTYLKDERYQLIAKVGTGLIYFGAGVFVRSKKKGLIWRIAGNTLIGSGTLLVASAVYQLFKK